MTNATEWQETSQGGTSQGGSSQDSGVDIHEEFLQAVESSDVKTVENILENNPGFKVDFTDNLGRTPLRLAVTNENKEVRGVRFGLKVGHMENKMGQICDFFKDEF